MRQSFINSHQLQELPLPCWTKGNLIALTTCIALTLGADVAVAFG